MSCAIKRWIRYTVLHRMHMLSYKPLVGFGHTDNTDTYRLPVLARVANLASHTAALYLRARTISQH